MKTVSVQEAEAGLSGLLADVEAGGEVVIERAGKPVAKLVPCQDTTPEIQLGTARGMFALPAGWDDPLTDDELAQLEGPPVATAR